MKDFGTFAIIALVIASIAGMATHIWVCVATNWAALLIVGFVIPPVGIIHGWGIWFGWWG